MRGAIVVAVVGLARVADAAPVATASLDVDGDGAADALSLDATGVLHVGGKLAGDVALSAQATGATLSVGPVAGKPAIAATVTTARGRDGFVVTHGDKGWHIAWRGEVGPVDLDGEYSIELAGTPAGVLRYQSRPGVARCDGKPAYLFAEAFDGTAFVRRRQLPSDVDPAAAKLAIKTVTDVADAPLVYQATWASIERGAGDASALARPVEIDDGSLATAWFADGASDGDGQFIRFDARGADRGRPAHHLRVVAGDHASATALARAGRPRQLAIVTATGAWRVDLPDAAHDSLQTAYVVDLPGNIAGCVTIVVASTYPGAQPLAISELALYADGEGPAMLAHDVAADAPGAKSEAAALARQGSAAVPAVADELGHTTDGGARERLVDVLVAIHDHDAASELAKAAVAGWIADDQAVPVTRVLAGEHMVQTLRELAAKASSLDVRLAAAGALDATTPDGAAALVELAGMEPRALRHRVIERLANAPVATLIAAAKAAPAAAASGDLWHAAARAAHGTAITPADRAVALAAMRDALATAPDYERRYRLVDGVATLGDASDLAALAQAVAKLEPAEAAALRQVAAMAIGAAPRPEALELMLALAADGDAGVRLAALAALQRSDDERWGASNIGRIDHALDGVLAGDRWVDVRERAAEGLGLRCQRPEPAHALVAAATGDSELAVREKSLVALVQCQAPGTAELLAKIFDDDKLPLVLRAHAIGDAVALADPALAATLLKRFDTWRGSALQNKDDLQLATEAANAIGHLAPPGAANSLVDALDDSAFPEIVGAAALGLGTLGKACPTSAKAKLAELAKSDDQQVRIPAKKAAAACGR